LCENEKLGLILITHDLAVVSQVTQRIAVMYAGRVVELGDTQQIVHAPVHPYTKGLLAALPQEGGRGKRLAQIPGMMPNLADVPAGCAFSERCALSRGKCRRDIPLLAPAPHGQGAVACHFLEQEDQA